MQQPQKFLLLLLPGVVLPNQFQSMHLQPPWLSSVAGQTDTQPPRAKTQNLMDTERCWGLPGALEGRRR